MEATVFIVSAVFVLAGALGVVALAKNPVHAALSLVLTLFGIAVQFILLDAHFLAAIQVIVYAGAIVILFLFVLMLLGVDKVEDLGMDPLRAQNAIAVIVGGALAGIVLAVTLAATDVITGQREANEALDPAKSDIQQLGEALFTDHVVAFELTGVLLTIAVVGAVVFARKTRGDLAPIPEPEPLDRPVVDAAPVEGVGH